ncbi:helix-turn-helix domain-containing protein [Cloacibacillus porcorum]|uniref:helix-turn-helix domain-containing protein n=1 Tax=Cloacibacillus porcorum TaxID=1197717 RepID=UPI0025899F19|nr:helix-turn-helix domain-containing protein [Cloacibacillus porcorum]
MNILGERIKSLIKHKKLKQKDLAEKIGVLPNTFTRWVNGNRTPDISMLTRIALILGTSTSYLTGETDDPAPMNMENILGKRIKENRLLKGFSGQELADLIGVSQTVIYQYEEGNRNPSTGTLSKIAKVLDTSIDYLMGFSDTASPSELTETTSELKNPSEASEAPEESVKIVTDQYVLIPVVNVHACAGNGNGYPDFHLETKELYPILKTDLIGHAWQSDGFNIIEIDGDSMEPKYRDGDRVLFVAGESVSSDDIIIALWNDKLYIRGYFPEKDQIILKPRNPMYPHIEIPCGDSRFIIIGKVIAKIPKIEKDRGFSA